MKWVSDFLGAVRGVLCVGGSHGAGSGAASHRAPRIR